MNFQEKGWLKKYLQTRNHYALHREYQRIVELKNSDASPEQILYDLVQPTGLLYGYPTQLPYQYKALLKAVKINKLPPRDKSKIILLESLLYSALTSERYYQLESEIDVADAFLEAAYRVGDYYKSVYQGIDTKYKTLFFYQERKGMDLTEFILNTRTTYKTHFWSSFINSSLLFIDILCFHQWIPVYQSAEKTQLIAQQHERLRVQILKTMVIAAYANQTIEKEEEQLVDYYLEAALFSGAQQEICRNFLAKGLSLANLNIKPDDSLVFRKYLLELAVLVVSADNIITDSEKAFIDHFCQKLALPEQEAEASILTVESFVYEHGQKMGYTHQREASDALQHHLLTRLTAVCEAHQATLSENIRKERVYDLLVSAWEESLRTDERKTLREGLLNALSQLPVFTKNTLPKSLLTYSVLLTILPKSLIDRRAVSNQ